MHISVHTIGNYQATPLTLCVLLIEFYNKEKLQRVLFLLFNIRNLDLKLSFENASTYLLLRWTQIIFTILKQASQWNLGLITCNYIDFHFSAQIFFHVPMPTADVASLVTVLQDPNCNESTRWEHFKSIFKAADERISAVSNGQPCHVPLSSHEPGQWLTLVKGKNAQIGREGEAGVHRTQRRWK